MILVTNYKENLIGVPVSEVLKGRRIEFLESSMEMMVDDSVRVGVFDKVPSMRRLDSNKEWFEKNIYHLR
jgi:hypothetical protein